MFRNPSRFIPLFLFAIAFAIIICAGLYNARLTPTFRGTATAFAQTLTASAPEARIEQTSAASNAAATMTIQAQETRIATLSASPSPQVSVSTAMPTATP